MPLLSDPSISTNKKVIISRVTFAVYIDDLLIASKNKADIFHVKELLKAEFEFKDLGKVGMVFGISVK